MAGNEEIGRLPDPRTYLSPHVVAHRNIDKARVQRINYERLPTRSRRSIFYLLEVYRTKGCKIPRDRIYSLLALCIEGPDIRVDYAIRHDELARNILQGCGDAFCLCSLRIIEHVLPRSFGPASSSTEQLSARLTLPANRGEESWYSDTPSIGVQHSHDAHTDTFTMNLSFTHMCERSSGVVSISRSSDREGFTYRCSRLESTTGIYVRTDETHRLHGCSIKLHDETESFTIYFSMDLLLEFAHVLNNYGAPSCCKRVSSFGIDRGHEHRKGILQLI